jgi:Tol biopolymer transport system component
MADRLQAGEQFSHYRIVSRIGRGGMGEVYLAKDDELERSVALKILNSDIAGDADRVQRFIQEAKVVSALNHPNILTIHEIGNQDGIRFIASEYVEGKTLRSVIDRGDLKIAEVIGIGRQIASALEIAHRKGVVHRDIKPENVIVREEGLVKVLDFGLAKLLNPLEPVESEAATKARAMTQFGMILGTVAYMSPEQARGNVKIDGRSDIWSLGVVIFEMMTGRRPFQEDSSTETIASILRSETPRISTYTENCPSELERIVQKSLQKDPDERYQVVRDMALDLKSLEKDLDPTISISGNTGARSRSNTLEFEGSHVTRSGLQSTIAEAVTQRRFIFGAGTAAFVMMTVFSAIWYFGLFSPTVISTSPAAAKTTEIVNWASGPGELYSSGNFSPDGRMIAFTSTRGGAKNIWIKQTSSGEPIQITKEELGTDSLVWSPDGEELAYFGKKGSDAGFWRIPTLGGTPKLIISLFDASSSLLLWSKSGSIYYSVSNDIHRIDVASGRTENISNRSSEDMKTAGLAISEDEQQIAFMIREGDKWILQISRLGIDEPRTLVESPAEIRNVIWHPDGNGLFYSSPVDGVFQIFSLGTDRGRQPEQMSFSERDSFVLDAASDGSKLLFGSAKEESDLWSVDVATGKETIIASEIDSELWPSVSPDSKAIAYQSVKNLSQGNNLFKGTIFSRSLTALSQPSVVTQNGSLPMWSPDGRSIASMSVEGDKHRIGTASASGSGSERILTAGVVSPSYSIMPYNRVQVKDMDWSPDSSRIAYISARSGHFNIWLAAADGSSDIQLTGNSEKKTYIYAPMWSDDGKQIAYTMKTAPAASGQKPTYSVWIIDVETKSTKEVYKALSFVRLLGWAEQPGELIAVTTDASESSSIHAEIRIHSVHTANALTKQIDSAKDVYVKNVFLSGDRKNVAYAAHRDGKDDLWVLPLTAGKERKLTSNNDDRLYFSSLAWSPDGKTIYFGKQSRYSLLSMLTNFR